MESRAITDRATTWPDTAIEKPGASSSSTMTKGASPPPAPWGRPISGRAARPMGPADQRASRCPNSASFCGAPSEPGLNVATLVVVAPAFEPRSTQTAPESL